MSYFDDAKELVNHAKPTLEKIKAAYNDSLHDQTIKPALLIEIKNFMENLRSALDFTAHGLFDKYGNGSSGNVYFPYAWSGLTQSEYRSKNIINKIPGLASSRPDIAMVIEGYQYFSDADNNWLPIFMDLNNENKHSRLTPQTRTEHKQLVIGSNGASMSIGAGASIIIGGGASIQLGNAIITGNQTIDVNNPARMTGQGTQEIITWVSFHFSTNNESVLPLLEKALLGSEKIVTELSGM